MTETDDIVTMWTKIEAIPKVVQVLVMVLVASVAVVWAFFVTPHSVLSVALAVVLLMVLLTAMVVMFLGRGRARTE